MPHIQTWRFSRIDRRYDHVEIKGISYEDAFAKLKKQVAKPWMFKLAARY